MTEYINSENPFYFEPIFSQGISLYPDAWIAIHPKPKGIIQFVGGFLSGSFPNLRYQRLLTKLFEARYTIIALPFPLDFLQLNHWSIAINLLRQNYRAREAIIRKVNSDNRLSNQEKHQNIDVYLQSSNYYWVGHSLGCKYLILLEVLSDEREKVKNIVKGCIVDAYKKIEKDIDDAQTERERLKSVIEAYIGKSIDIETSFIRGQPSLLIAPDISKIEDTLPSSLLISLFKAFNNNLFPTREETLCLMGSSIDLFNLTAIISFQDDRISVEEIPALIAQLERRRFGVLNQELPGGHDEPIEGEIDRLVDRIIQFLAELHHRAVT